MHDYCRSFLSERGRPPIEDHGFEYELAPLAHLFETSRRTTWPFHIHNPDRTITGTKTNRVAGA